VANRAEVTAWRPDLPGVAEVLHAHFIDHAYPAHTHEVWTLLIVDDGAVRFDLNRHEHGALRGLVTLLPPQVPHDGRAATAHGFRKRVLYLDPEVLGTDLIGAAVDRPGWADPALRLRIHQLHGMLDQPGERLAAQSRLALLLALLFLDAFTWNLEGSFAKGVCALCATRLKQYSASGASGPMGRFPGGSLMK